MEPVKGAIVGVGKFRYDNPQLKEICDWNGYEKENGGRDVTHRSRQEILSEFHLTRGPRNKKF